MAAVIPAVTPFVYAEKGSRVLREWNMQRAIARRQRAQTRSGFGQNSGGFAGAAVGRLTASLAQWSGSVNADLDGTIGVLRARARALCANTEFGRRFLTLAANNIIGGDGYPRLQVRAYNSGKDGILDKPANDAIESHWVKWGKRADITGKMSFSQMLRVAIKGAARDGEALIRVIRDRKLTYGYALQLLEADRLDDAINQRLSNGNSVRQGVEMDSRGTPVAYYIRGAHPGENYSAGPSTVERVPAGDVFHLFLPDRAEQVRGYTWFHAILSRANMLHGFEEAAVVAARVGASKMGVFEQSVDAAGDLNMLGVGLDADGNIEMSGEPGEFVKLPPGVTLNSWNPDYPHANFDSFIKACMRGLASGLDVAAHNLGGDMTEVNYSSARIAELSERDSWMVLQDWFFSTLLQKLYADWLATALIKGDITLDSGAVLPADRLSKFIDVSRFQGRRWQWVDPAKEISANVDAITNHLKSRTRIVAEQGEDYEDVLYEIDQEAKLAQAVAGIDLRASAKPAVPKPQQPGDENA